MIPLPPGLAPCPGAPGAFTFQMEGDHPAYAGHFPDHPVLPGVVQVEWALRLAEECFGSLGTFTALEQLKFQGLIQPKERIDLTLAWNAATATLSFAYVGETGPKSSGLARFALPS